jgi:protein AaeX
MIGEIEIHGVFIPTLLFLGIVAFFVRLVLGLILRRLQFYRFVWHAGLFDTALYVVILWVAALVSMLANSSGVGP